MKKDEFIDKALSRDEETISTMFSREAKHYDLLNHLLSFNLDKLWRKTLAQRSNYAQYGEDVRLLDLCCGTGDVALEFVNRKDFKGHATGVDFSEEMLLLAREKSKKAGVSNRVEFRHGNALDLNFEDNSFHLVTIAFGLRNLVNLDKGLSEMYRVLKPGGQLLSLEFFKPESGVSRTLSNWYVKGVIPVIGRIFTGRWGAYDYLSASREKFYTADEFSAKAKSHGFTKISHGHFLFRVATLHIAVKE